MSAPPLRGLVLDFDGVLVESEGVKTAAFQAVFDRYPDHAAAMMAFHDAHVALPREAKFRELSRRTGGGDAQIQELLAAFSALAIERVTACAEVPGAAAFLDEFSRRLPVFLASVTPVHDLRAVLARRGWLAHFAGVYGEPPTRKADAVLEIIGRLRATPGALLFVGDTPADWRVAEETGVPFLARDGGLWPGGAPHPSVRDMREAAVVVRDRLPAV